MFIALFYSTEKLCSIFNVMLCSFYMSCFDWKKNLWISLELLTSNYATFCFCLISNSITIFWHLIRPFTSDSLRVGCKARCHGCIENYICKRWCFILVCGKAISHVMVLLFQNINVAESFEFSFFQSHLLGGLWVHFYGLDGGNSPSFAETIRHRYFLG